MSFRNKLARILAGLSLCAGAVSSPAGNSSLSEKNTVPHSLPLMRLNIYLAALRQADPVQTALRSNAKHPTLHDYLGYAYGAQNVQAVLEKLETYRRAHPEFYFASDYTSPRMHQAAPRGVTPISCGHMCGSTIYLNPDSRLAPYQPTMIAQHETFHWATQKTFGWNATFKTAAPKQSADVRSTLQTVLQMPIYYVPTPRFLRIGDGPYGVGLVRADVPTPISDGIPDLGTYLLHPNETDVRLAEFKRIYAVMSGGKVIETPEDALRALLQLGFNIKKEPAEEVLQKAGASVCPDAYDTPAWDAQTIERFESEFPDIALLKALFNGQRGHHTILDTILENEPIDFPPASTQPSLERLLIKLLLLKTPGVAVISSPKAEFALA